MAELTLYANNPLQSGSSAGLLDPTAPTASTSTTGWTVNSVGVGRYSLMTFGTEIPSTGLTATAQPSGAPITTAGKVAEDCWRTSAVTSGIISAGTFLSAISVIAVSSGGNQDGRMRCRLWYSANADGSSAVELTKGTMVGTIVTNLTTTVAQSSSASTALSRSTLTDAYLFWQVAWEITGAGNNASRDVLIRLGAESRISFSDFSATAAGGGGGAVFGTGYYTNYYKGQVGDLY